MKNKLASKQPILYLLGIIEREIIHQHVNKQLTRQSCK